MCNMLHRFALTAIRFYRRYPGRKSVQVETKIKSPKRYDELRGGNPAILLQGNLFTPESAGPRELSMLCFKIVNMGYADSGILLRYVECTIKMLSKLRVKHIALVMQSVSKYLAKNVSVLSNAEDTTFHSEIASRENLLLKVVELAELLSPIMNQLLLRALPKDIGMVALSIVTICERATKELDNSTHATILKLTESILKQVAEAIGPKLPFCELTEYAALAKAFCKIPQHVEYADMFIRDLASEISCLLSEKVDQLAELVSGKYIGDDLVDELVRMPRELTTIACALSRRIQHHKMWQRMTQCIELMLQMGVGPQEMFSTLDSQTLLLLATSMSRHADVSFLLEALLGKESKTIQTDMALISIGISQRTLRDDELAQRFWDSIDFTKIPELDDHMKAQVIHAAVRIPNIKDYHKTLLRSFYSRNCLPELLAAMYVARHRLSIDPSAEMIDGIMGSINGLAVNSLVLLLKSAQENNELCSCLLRTLKSRLDEVHDDKLCHLAMYIVEKHGQETEMIEKLLSKIADAPTSQDRSLLALLIDKLSGLGFDYSRFFDASLIDHLVHILPEEHRMKTPNQGLDAPQLEAEEETASVEPELRENNEEEIVRLSCAIKANRVRETGTKVVAC